MDFIISKEDKLCLKKIIMEISSQSNINPNKITKIFNKYKIKSGIKLNKAFILRYFNYLTDHKLINFTGDNIKAGDIVNVEVTDAKTWSLDGKLSK